MLIPLADATSQCCGSKATALARLLTQGLPVPDGFVVPFQAQIARPELQVHPSLPASWKAAISRQLHQMGDPVVAVRSSAAKEDTAQSSAAGQYDSVLGVRGVEEVSEAILTCWKSAHTTQVAHYRQHSYDATPLGNNSMAGIVQRMIAADVSGVLFTQPNGTTRIEASWGLGTSVVDGTVTPDAYHVTSDGAISSVIGSKMARTDVRSTGDGVITRSTNQTTPIAALNDEAVLALAKIGNTIARLLGGPQDIEWAIANDKIWILQARPITATLPALSRPDLHQHTLTGTPGSHGVVTANARLVHGPEDFPSVMPGEVLICPYTTPAWTPLFAIAAGVVTSTGGALSHAAIVAREYGVPAVLGVNQALEHIRTGDQIQLDGTAGTITVLQP